MGEVQQLRAADGHTLHAYVARPVQPPTGAVVVIQEIFGVNDYIRRVADGFAAQGYMAVAPSLFDRVGPGIELGYDGEALQQAIRARQQLKVSESLLDVAAAFEEARSAERGVGVVGFCYGGLLSWLTATRGEDLQVRPDACVAYYPGGIGEVAAEEPSCPVMVHVGADDSHVPVSQIEEVKRLHPAVETFVYPGADHGFSCDARAAFNADAAGLAGRRTMEFLRTHIA